jgi:uncharacterized membrane protein YccC
MSGTSELQDSIRAGETLERLGADLTNVVKTAGPPLLFGLRVWASVSLALYLAFWLQLDDAVWAGTSAAIVCQPHLGASLRKGWYRLIGTLVGAVMIVVLTALFPQDRAPFLVGLALWCAVSALGATLLHNFAAYSAALAGYTAAIVAADILGATGGPNGHVFLLAVYRASEICLGIVCAGVVLAGTDLGNAPRRLARLFATLSIDITRGFTGTLASAGPGQPDTQPARRELTRRIIALDPVIDEALGESSDLRYHSPLLQMAMDGLFAAVAGWRAVAVRLAGMPGDKARQEADAVLRSLPEELRSVPAPDGPKRWMADPVGLRRICDATVRRLLALPAGTPSLQLLADQTAGVLIGISEALDGLATLVASPARRAIPRRAFAFRVPDWLPALVNAGRAFIVVGVVELFWIVTQWPNGAFAITFAAIGTTLLAPRAEQAYGAAVVFMIGTCLGLVFASIIAFAVLPGLEGFAAFSLALGLVLVPAGAMTAQTRWPTVSVIAAAVTLIFCPLLAPANRQSYDPVQFYNTGLAIVGGLSAAMLSFRLLPSPSPAFRARRLLALTLRDLRRLALRSVAWTPRDWENRVLARLVALPDQAEPLQRSQLMAALSVGSEIIRLRRVDARHPLGPDLDAAFTAVAQGKSAAAIARLALLDDRLASAPHLGSRPPVPLRTRARILEMSELLTHHAAYFDTGAAA